MMSNTANLEAVKYIVSRLIESANEAKAESDKDKKNDFEAGRKTAYYEMLDILQSELDAHDFDLSEFGLDVDLTNTYL